MPAYSTLARSLYCFSGRILEWVPHLVAAARGEDTRARAISCSPNLSTRIDAALYPVRNIWAPGNLVHKNHKHERTRRLSEPMLNAETQSLGSRR